jgi:hypothetical protein
LFAQYCCVLEGFTASGKQAAATADFDTPCIFRRRLKILDRANAHTGRWHIRGRTQKSLDLAWYGRSSHKSRLLRNLSIGKITKDFLQVFRGKPHDSLIGEVDLDLHHPRSPRLMYMMVHARKRRGRVRNGLELDSSD